MLKVQELPHLVNQSEVQCPDTAERSWDGVYHVTAHNVPWGDK